MPERQGSIGWLLKIRAVSFLIVGGGVVVASLMNLVALISVKHGYAKPLWLFQFITDVVPLELLIAGSIVSLVSGAGLVLFAVLAMAFDG